MYALTAFVDMQERGEYSGRGDLLMSRVDDHVFSCSLSSFDSHRM